MKHNRKDYQERIQDSAGLIPDDEPVFLIRASDPAGALAVAIYALIAREKGSPDDLVQSAHEHSREMEAWHTDELESIGKSKPADLPD